MTTPTAAPFVPVVDSNGDDRWKACPLCGQKCTRDAPDPRYHHCGPRARPRCGPRGLGDSVAAVLKPIARLIGWETCPGCNSRQATLNRWWPYADKRAQEAALARLAVCAKCDQAVGGACTMSGLTLATVAPDLQATCPGRRWPHDPPFLDATDAAPLATHAAAIGGPPLIQLPPADQPAAMLIYFPHGLGDHAQLTSVLAHLRAVRPLLAIDVLARASGAALLTHLARRVYVLGREAPAGPYSIVTKLRTGHRPSGWDEPQETWPDAPATKTTRALRACLGLPRRPELHGYHLPEPPEAIDQAAGNWTKTLDRPFVLVHPRGRCGPQMKNIPDDALRATLAAIRAAGACPVLIDYDGVCRDVLAGTADQPSRAAQGATGNLLPVLNAATCPEAASPLFLIALARRARLTIGIDSGPGHIFQSAAACPPSPISGEGPGVRAIIYWRRHHPVNYSDAADARHVCHLVPAGHGVWIKGDRATGEAYFAQHYRHQIYTDPARGLAAAIGEALSR